MSPFEKNLGIRQGIFEVMKQGGYYDSIMNAGSELDRVKQFLQDLEAPRHRELREKQHPTVMPLFPGLDCRPFREAEGDPVAEYLQARVPALKEVAYALRNRRLSFSGGVVTDGAWQIYPLWYMGMSLPFMTMHSPRLKEIAEGIPRCGKLHPFSEALLSWQKPGTHLGAHCSVDNVRLRYSVGVIVEDYCEIRVGNTKKQWREGETIVFEDCFEHETWNGEKDRLVFIIDTWHPDLTDVEKEALCAGFRKKEVRKILYEFRLTEAMRSFLLQQFEEEDKNPLFDRYWNRSKTISQPVISDWGVWDTVPVFKDGVAKNG